MHRLYLYWQTQIYILLHYCQVALLLLSAFWLSIFASGTQASHFIFSSLAFIGLAVLTKEALTELSVIFLSD